MPKINKKFLKDYFATRGPRPSLLKFSVASSLIVFGITASVFLVGGLLVPESVLLKLSGQPENSASALVGNSEAGTNDTLDKSTGIDVGSNSTAPTTSSSATPTTTNTATGSTPSTTPANGSGGTVSPPSGGSTPTAVAPALTLVASPTTITSGGTTVVSWSIASGATQPVTCTASNAWSGAKATSGSENKTPTSTSTYTLVCANSAGQSSKSVAVTVNPPASTCGSGGSCTSANVTSHNTAGDCWVIVAYSASGGNGTGKVYKLASGFFGSSGSHGGLAGAPSLSASSWCGKNISSTFNNKHSGGTRSDSGNTAIWWLTGNGNSLIGNWTGN